MHSRDAVVLGSVLAGIAGYAWVIALRDMVPLVARGRLSAMMAGVAPPLKRGTQFFGVHGTSGGLAVLSGWQLPRTGWFLIAAVSMVVYLACPRDSGRIVAVLWGLAAVAVAIPRMVRGYSRRVMVNKVERALPEVIDLMVVCADAGMSLHMSLKYVAEATGGLLGDQLKSIVSAVSTGAGLADALRELGKRCPSPGLRFFARTVAQSHERGNPVSDVLKAQAWMVRQQQRQALDAIVKAMPTKIAMCSILFFMPAIFAVTVLPGILMFLQSGW